MAPGGPAALGWRRARAGGWLAGEAVAGARRGVAQNRRLRPTARRAGEGCAAQRGPSCTLAWRGSRHLVARHRPQGPREAAQRGSSWAHPTGRELRPLSRPLAAPRNIACSNSAPRARKSTSRDTPATLTSMNGPPLTVLLLDPLSPRPSVCPGETATEETKAVF
jgi:hypothetical protein